MRKTVILLVLSLSLFSCRSVKKQFEELKAQTDYKTDSIAKELSIFKQTAKQEVFRDVFTEVGKTLKSQNEKINESNSKITTIRGEIRAEEGKIKQAEANGLKIRSNGANITFETIVNNKESKEIQANITNMQERVKAQEIIISSLQSQIDKYDQKIAKINTEIETLRDIKTKNVTKKNITFYAWVIIGVLILFAVFYKRIKGYLKI